MDVGAATQSDGLPPGATLREAAARVLRARLGAVMDRLPAAAAGGPESVTHVHKLRVATRKAGAALDIFEPCIRPKDLRRARRRLKMIRRAAGQVRDMDVLAALLSRARKKAPSELHPAVDALLDRAAFTRANAAERLARVAKQNPRSKLRERRKRVLRNLRDAHAGDAEAPETFAHAGRITLAAMAADLRAAGEADLASPDNLHEVRLAGKRLRYAVEIYGSCAEAGMLRDLAPHLEEMQEALGAINDCHQMVVFARAALDEQPAAPGAKSQDGAPAPISPPIREGVETLAQRWSDQRAAKQAAFIEWWEGFRALGRLDAFESALAQRAPLRGSAPRPAHAADAADESRGSARPDEVARPAPGLATARAWRIGAIDVGTNSIRLIVAEAFGVGNYRVLDDEREIARLGAGLASTGQLSADAVERAITVIDHMRRIAEGYGVERLRVVGTAAVREASNGEEFRRLLRERTGLAIEIIDAEQEAKLAHVSAANAFDLRSLPAAVVDVGGGSTEIVLSSGPVIERVYKAPLGAVRLTEKFGGPQAAAGKRFEAMRRHIARELKERVADLPFSPQLLVGSGGTFEALAKVAMQARGARAASATVRGYDMTRSEVRRLLERLRDMPLRERLRVPGLSEQRAEIIVAGAAIAHAVMRRLGADRMRVNDGGIRDGILLAMIGEYFGAADAGAHAQPGREPPALAQMRSVRRFAGSCNYERKHCYHVAALALQLYDQLIGAGALAAAADARAGPAWRAPQARLLLEAAGVLHDCGYHINYARHHLHSYHLIMHSDMAGFTRREIEIIANVARYHRGPSPKGKHENLADLSRADRELVRALGAVLRVADGLDRTHMQNVRTLRLEVRPDAGAPARLIVEAPADPAVDIWGSQRKSDLFRDVFGAEIEYEWRSPPGDRPGSAPPGASAGAGAPGANQAATHGQHAVTPADIA